MRFVVDNALSPRLADLLRSAGHDAVHVLSRGMETASDLAIIELAASEDRIVITFNADFSRILALESRAKPSLLVLRGDLPRRAGPLARLVLDRLSTRAVALDQGAIVLISPRRTRVRELPVSKRSAPHE